MGNVFGWATSCVNERPISWWEIRRAGLVTSQITIWFVGYSYSPNVRSNEKQMKQSILYKCTGTTHYIDTLSRFALLTDQQGTINRQYFVILIGKSARQWQFASFCACTECIPRESGNTSSSRCSLYKRENDKLLSVTQIYKVRMGRLLSIFRVRLNLKNVWIH